MDCLPDFYLCILVRVLACELLLLCLSLLQTSPSMSLILLVQQVSEADTDTKENNNKAKKLTDLSFSGAPFSSRRELTLNGAA